MLCDGCLFNVANKCLVSIKKKRKKKPEKENITGEQGSTSFCRILWLLNIHYNALTTKEARQIKHSNALVSNGVVVRPSTQEQ